MINFLDIKNHFLMTKEENSKFFLVKDYEIGRNYIVDLGCANFLFGRYNIKTGLQSDYLMCASYLSYSGLHYEMVHDEKTNTVTRLYQDTRYCYSLGGEYSEGLNKRIKELKREIMDGKSPQTRDKTQEEFKNGRTVRLIGCYKDLNSAIADFGKIRSKQQNEISCKPEERIIIKRTYCSLPTDFKGKVIQSPTARELI